MKQINFFYSEISGEYILNEQGEFNSDGKEVYRFKGSTEALNFIASKYPKRKLLLSCRISEEDLEKAKDYLSSIDSKIDIE